MKKNSVFQGTMHNICEPYTAPRLAVIRSCVGPLSLHCATSTWMHACQIQCRTRLHMFKGRIGTSLPGRFDPAPLPVQSDNLDL
jgi:hypothetical protein